MRHSFRRLSRPPRRTGEGAQARRQGGLSVERMCALAGVSRTGYYRRWRQFMEATSWAELMPWRKDDLSRAQAAQ